MTDKARAEFDRKHESAISAFKDWYCSDYCPSELDVGMFEMARSAWLAAKEKHEPRWIPEPEMDSYEGWCWIVYKGRVTEAYRDHNYSYRFGKHSQNCYLTECITLAMKWEYPDAPSTQGEE